MAKLRMAHASTHGARKPPGPKKFGNLLTNFSNFNKFFKLFEKFEKFIQIFKFVKRFPNFFSRVHK